MRRGSMTWRNNGSSGGRFQASMASIRSIPKTKDHRPIELSGVVVTASTTWTRPTSMPSSSSSLTR